MANKPGSIFYTHTPGTHWRLPTYSIQLRTWTWSYNLNLIGQDKMTVGKIVTDLAPGQKPISRQPYNLGTWTWSYNLNLIGQDKFPPGDISTALTVKPYEYHVQLRTWTWNYNLNLIGKDAMTVGEIVTDLPPGQLPPRPLDLRTWTWSYNLSLIGKDIVPGKKALDLPIPPDYPTQLRQWFSQLPPPVPVEAAPFAQYDWPLSFGPQQPERTVTVSYNLNLIGQDFFPPGRISTALPPIPDYPVSLRSWLTTPAVPPVAVVTYMPARVLEWGTPLAIVGLLPDSTFPISLALTTPAAANPFAQYDWPINYGPRQPIQTFTASYNLNLIGQDKLPFRQQDWPLPTQPARQPDLSSWIDRTKLLLAVPFKQTDWPLPRGYLQPAQSFTASYNLNLIGQDKLPVGEIVTDRPTLLAPTTLQTWISTVNLALTTAAAIPPVGVIRTELAIGPPPPLSLYSLAASFNLNLIGQDKLPSGKVITGLPPQPDFRPDFTFLQGFQLPLQPVTPPIVVGGHILSSRSHFMYGDTLS